MVKISLKTAAFLSLALCFTALRAEANLIGTSVSGVMKIGSTNYFDPAHGFVPGGYLNTAGTTVTISSTATEFGFQDGANLDTANFTGSQLTLTDVSNSNSIAIQYTFTDTAFTSLSLVSNSFPAGMTSSFVGDVITINAPSLSSPGTYQAVFNVGSSSVPDGGATAALLGLALTGLAGLRRKFGI